MSSGIESLFPFVANQSIALCSKAQYSKFAVPNLQDRVPIGEGHSAGLSYRSLGSDGVADSVLFTTGNLPSRSHGTFALPDLGDRAP